MWKQIKAITYKQILYRYQSAEIIRKPLTF